MYNVAAVAEIAQGDLKLDLRGVGIYVACVNVNAVYLVLFAECKTDGAIYAHCNESVDPVPAVSALNAAGVHSLAGERSGVKRHALNALYGREKSDLKRVFALANYAVNAKFVRDKHIVNLAELYAVKVYVSIGVESFKFNVSVI